MKKAILLSLLATTLTLASYATGPILGPTSTCVGWTVQVTDVTTGGIWTSSNPSVATVTADVVPGTAKVYGVGAGYCTISYACSGSGTQTITFVVNPAPSITGPATVCDGQVVQYTGYPTGGQWVGTPSSIVKVDPYFTFSTTADAKFFSTGTVEIKYTIGGCYAVLAVTSNPSPCCIEGPAYVNCSCSCPKTFTCSSPGGTWSTSDASVAYVDASGVLHCSSTGCIDVIYTLPNGCSLKKSVTVTSSMPHLGSDISGDVNNNEGGSMQPEDHMGVNLYDAGGNLVASTLTNGSGHYSLSGVPDGMYTVKPVQAGYSSTSSAVNINAANPTATADFVKNVYAGSIAPGSAAVNTLSADADFNVYPNPTKGIMNINWKNQITGSANVMVTDITGRQVLNTVIEINSTGHTSFDLSALEGGLYMVSVKSNNIAYNGRLLIEK